MAETSIGDTDENRHAAGKPTDGDWGGDSSGGIEFRVSGTGDEPGAGSGGSPDGGSPTGTRRSHHKRKQPDEGIPQATFQAGPRVSRKAAEVETAAQAFGVASAAAVA